eukprot:scaffold34_cov260-Pinguiococcus_pyrenoidosus.AAC.34
MEMKTAYDLAVDRGVTVILGDRPLEITWQRLVKQIDFWSSLRLLLSAVLGTRDLLRDDADEAPHIEKKVTQLSSADPDTVESLLKKFKKEIPSVMQVSTLPPSPALRQEPHAVRLFRCIACS